MAHLTARAGYTALVERLNRFPQGAPPSELLYKILQLLFTEREASLVALLPIKPFTVADASRAWRMPVAAAQQVLDTLADRAILLDIDDHGQQRYVLPPPMAGFFEFSMMRVRGDIDQHMLAELFYQYMNVEEDFIKALFTRGETQLGRVFVHEPAVPDGLALHVLDYERASHIVQERHARSASGTCYCRHKMAHVGPRLRRADGHLHDLRHGGRVAGQARVRARDRRGGVSRPARTGARPAPGAVRRERARRRELHLQLLRVLLRGDDRRTAVRVPAPRPHHELRARRVGRRLQRVRQVRLGLPGRGDEPRLGTRPACVRRRRSLTSTPTRASAAASASAPASASRCR